MGGSPADPPPGRSAAPSGIRPGPLGQDLSAHDHICPLHVNISPRCTALAPDSRVAARRNRAWLFLLTALCSRARSTHLTYRNHMQRV